MSVQTRSLIWGLPQFQKPSTESKIDVGKSQSLDSITLKSDRKTFKKVSNILVQLTETQTILVDYTDDNSNVVFAPNKIKNKLPIAPVSNSSKKIIDKISTEVGNSNNTILKLPTWSLDQTKLQFCGYLNNKIKPAQGQIGDFYLNMIGDIWIMDIGGWKKMTIDEILEK